MHILERVTLHSLKLKHCIHQCALVLPDSVGPVFAEKAAVARAQFTVELPKLAANLFIVALDRIKGLAGNAIAQKGGRGAEQTIAALDMRVEIEKRLTRLDGFHP